MACATAFLILTSSKGALLHLKCMYMFSLVGDRSVIIPLFSLRVKYCSGSRRSTKSNSPFINPKALEFASGT